MPQAEREVFVSACADEVDSWRTRCDEINKCSHRSDVDPLAAVRRPDT